MEGKLPGWIKGEGKGGEVRRRKGGEGSGMEKEGAGSGMEKGGRGGRAAAARGKERGKEER